MAKIQITSTRRPAKREIRVAMTARQVEAAISDYLRQHLDGPLPPSTAVTKRTIAWEMGKNADGPFGLQFRWEETPDAD